MSKKYIIISTLGVQKEGCTKSVWHLGTCMSALIVLYVTRHKTYKNGRSWNYRENIMAPVYKVQTQYIWLHPYRVLCDVMM